MEELLFSSADMLWESIINMPAPFGVVNASIVKRLFNILAKREKKYHARIPEDYISESHLMLVTSRLGVDVQVEKPSEPEMVAGNEKKNEDYYSPTSYRKKTEDVKLEKPAESTCSAQETTVMKEGGVDPEETVYVPENPLLDLGAGMLQGVDLDEQLGITGIVNGETKLPEKNSMSQENERESVSFIKVLNEQKNLECPVKRKEVKKTSDEGNNERDAGKAPGGKEVSQLIPGYYDLGEEASFFVYGSDSPEVDKSLLAAFSAGSTYFCIEIVRYHNDIGTLLMNSDNDFVFYNVELYGPAFFRKAADKKITFFTTNICGVAGYLQARKVFHVELQDVGIAEYFFRGREHFYSENFNLDMMKRYKNSYENFLNNVDEAVRNKVYIMEKFLPLLSSSGKELPFPGINTVAMLNKRYEITFSKVFATALCALHSGTMIKMKAVVEADKLPYEIEMCYEQVCIDLDLHYRLSGREVFILNIDKDGIILYVVGNRLSISEFTIISVLKL